MKEKNIDVELLRKEIVEAVYKGELSGEEMQKMFRFIHNLEKKNVTKWID